MWQVACSRALALLAAIALIVGGQSAPASAAPLVDPTSVQQMLTTVVTAYAVKSSSSDQVYFSNGDWIAGGQELTCWRCSVGPAVAAAVLANRTGNTTMRDLAMQTFDHAVASHQTAAGSVFTTSPSEPGGPDINTMFFATQLGTAYMELKDQLSPTQKVAWARGITGSADYLIANGNLSWYTNGNINIGNALVMKLAYLAGNDPRYGTAYEQALSFAISPNQTRWPGFGLQYSVVPTRPDGSDGAAYFAESGGGYPGFDADYTHTQLDLLTRLYLVSHDNRIPRLMNLLANQLLPRVNVSAAALDTSGGTRHPQPNRFVGFHTGAIEVLAKDLGRSDLAATATALWPGQDLSFRGSMGYINIGMWYLLGAMPTSLYMNLVDPPAPPVPPTNSTTTTTPAAGSSPVTTTTTLPPAPVVAPESKSGYWMVSDTGTVFAFGDAGYFGGRETSGVVNVAPTPSGDGYFILDERGGVSAHGNAIFSGDLTGSLRSGERAVSISPDTNSNGYWIFTSLGRAAAFGGAPFYGDVSHLRLNGPVLNSVVTPTGHGYYMVASDGGVFSFGDAAFQGSMGGLPLNAPVEALVPNPGGGYWLVASDGGVFAFNAPFRGSMGGIRLNKPVVGMVQYGNGYLMVAADGGIFNFSTQPFHGSLGSSPPSRPLVAAAALS